MRRLNPDHARQVIELVNRAHYFRLLSMSILELGIGYSVVEMRLEDKHLNPFGGIHGGAYSSLIDTAAYWALYGDLEEGSGLISIDVNVHNLAVAKEGKLVARGKRVKAGKTVCLGEAVVYDEQKRIMAAGSSKTIVSPGLQTIEGARHFMAAGSLPPKFLDLRP
jgi:uncharacterized protein (TIGR00369 family)